MGHASSALLELRQYTLHPGTRETLVRLFEEQFIEGQEAHGMQVVGQFLDVGHPDRLVWLRGFASMEARRVAIDGFYNGPVWKAHCDAANATLIDWDNVLLLKPVSEDTAIPYDPASRRPIRTVPAPDPPGVTGGTGANGDSGASGDSVDRGNSGGSGDVGGDVGGVVVVATIYRFEGQVDPGFASWFRTEAMPVLSAAGTTVLAQLVTETAPNTSHRLPVREREHVFVWFARYPDRAAHEAASRTLAALPAWHDRMAPALRATIATDPERLVLSPTRRSLFR